MKKETEKERFHQYPQIPKYQTRKTGRFVFRGIRGVCHLGVLASLNTVFQIPPMKTAVVEFEARISRFWEGNKEWKMTEQMKNDGDSNQLLDVMSEKGNWKIEAFYN